MKNAKKITNIVLTMLCAGATVCVTSGNANVLAQDSKKHEERVKGNRDPFVKWKPPAPIRKEAVGVMPVPSLEVRINQFKALKAAAMSSQQPAPKPTTALLLNELQIIGIFRTPRGHAAMVEATPIKLSYVIYPGEQFFDGQLVAIEEERLVFRHETRLTNGKKEMAVMTKPLRTANAVTDSLAVAKAPSAPVTPAETVKEAPPASTATSPEKN
jgi:hypothetical protein